MRILIVDDHALVRRGMAYVVREEFPDAGVVEAEGTEAALDVMRSEAPDLALVDVRMPDLDGLELLRAMKLEWPDVPVIMLSTYENVPYLRHALAVGAAGYLLKDTTPEDLGHAINVAISGGVNILSPRAIRVLFEDLGTPVDQSANGPSTSRTEYNLTRREREILALISEGRSNRSIARNLYVSEKTVKTHLAAIFRKLGVTNRTQAAMMAVHLGVGPVPKAVTGTD